jgi:enoyl-CoA hydratase/carnithine racemase
MIKHSYSTLRVLVFDGIARVTINNPPVNVLDVRLMSELRQFLTAVHHDASVKVIVFDSANPDFFIAHVDMALIDEPHAFDELAKDAPTGLNVFQAFGEILRHQPQVTIAKLAGIARGGGAEFVAACDMCFAAIGRAGLAQCEALMGIVPGGGGTQYVMRKMGRPRALEAILGADLFDAETAERYGWINRALPADQLDVFVDRLARNIAVLPSDDLSVGLRQENNAWAGLFALPAAERLIRGGLIQGAQTPAGEHRLEELLRGVGN